MPFTKEKFSRGMMLRRKSRRPRSRKGAAAVEFASVLPLILLIFGGVVECTEILRNKSAVTFSTYESARLAAHQGVSATRVVSRCKALLKERGIVDFDVSVTPASIENLPIGTPISITVEARRTRSLLSTFLPKNAQITQTSTMLRE